MVVEWNDNLKTGITVIDEQHEGLFRTANKLEKAKTNKGAFYEILIELQTYITLHFATEEKYMKYTGYPEFDNHKACHDKFIKDYKGILKKVAELDNVMDIGPELVTFVDNWIIDHYTNEDVKMAAFLNNSSLDNI